MISAEKAREIRARYEAHEAARKKFDPKRYERGGGYDKHDQVAIMMMSGVVQPSNEELGDLEEYEFAKKPPERLFAYFDKTFSKITGFAGNKLGDIIWRGSEFRSQLGDKRVNVRVRGTNGLLYGGTCYTSTGTYCRLKKIKARR